jgi:hypothetical protein
MADMLAVNSENEKMLWRLPIYRIVRMPAQQLVRITIGHARALELIRKLDAQLTPPSKCWHALMKL